jgi:hypothetical protein
MYSDYTIYVEGDWLPPRTQKEEEFDTEDSVVVLFLDYVEIAQHQGLLHNIILIYLSPLN